ncbi:MAG: MurR/RpiR family transcriptional regulator, partial [Candidatus Eisenbacteria bacterium]|nr:MurR/RpiR family transcriptional regulator [Candidatus Eisenbacteria bacterium]
MNIQTQPQSISDLIAAVGADLTPVERKIAAAIVAEPTLPAFGSVSDLAEHVGTSRPSIVRFAQKLGFDGYSELQEHVQRRIAQRPTRPSDRIREEGEP